MVGEQHRRIVEIETIVEINNIIVRKQNKYRIYERNFLRKQADAIKRSVDLVETTIFCEDGFDITVGIKKENYHVKESLAIPEDARELHKYYHEVFGTEACRGAKYAPI